MGQESEKDATFLLMERIDKKMDTALSRMEVLSFRTESLEEQVKDLSNTVNGGPGVQGLITGMAVIQTKLESLLEIKNTPQAPAVAPAKPASDEKDKVTWSYLAEKLFLPVGVSALLWFLLTVLPQWIEHTGAP